MADTVESADGDRFGHELSAAIIRFHEAIAARLGVNLTEQKALDELLTNGTATPSALAERLGVSRAAVTKIVDRLASLGYVARDRHEGDGRSVRVSVTAPLTTRMAEIYGPVGSQSADLIAGFDEEQLTALATWLTGTIEILGRETDRLQQPPSPSSSPR